MAKERLIFIVRITVGIAAIVVTAFFELPKTAQFLICLFAYLVCAYDVLFKAAKRLISGAFLDENFLMSAASICAFALGETAEAVAVMAFYQVGEMLTDYAVDSGKKSLAALQKLCPETVTVISENCENTVDIAKVKKGDIIKIRPGQRVPLDCKTVFGQCSADTAAVTGESIPRNIRAGSMLSAGFLIIDGVVHAEVINDFDSSTLSRMMQIVEESKINKSKSEKFITKFARYYTPIVVATAVALFAAGAIISGNATAWLYRAMTFMTVSCPCALVLSVPLAFFCGISGASKKGILIKGGDCIERLKSVEAAVFDKTGTLTQGEFEVNNVVAKGIEKEELLMLAAAAESGSVHPIAKCIANACKFDRKSIKSITEKAGLGIEAVISNHSVIIGNEKLMKLHGISCDNATNAVHISVDGDYSGYMEISDKIKCGVENLCKDLKSAGVNKAFLLTGDSKANAQRFKEIFGDDGVFCELSPIDKVNKLEEIKKEYGITAFVGDGINDAPVIASSDVGFSMGQSGSDAAIETADVVLLTDAPERVKDAVGIAKRTVFISKMNVAMSIAIKILVLLFAALGVVGMWGAVAADVGVALLACCNSLRAAK